MSSFEKEPAIQLNAKQVKKKSLSFSHVYEGPAWCGLCKHKQMQFSVCFETGAAERETTLPNRHSNVPRGKYTSSQLWRVM